MKRATCRSPQRVRLPRLWLARPMGLASLGRPSGLVWSLSPAGTRTPVWISCPRCQRGSSSDAVNAPTRMSAAAGAGPRSSSSRPALARGSSQMPCQPVHVPRQPVNVPAMFLLARPRQAETAYSMFAVRINNTKQDQHHTRATPTNTTHCKNSHMPPDKPHDTPRSTLPCKPCTPPTTPRAIPQDQALAMPTNITHRTTHSNHTRKQGPGQQETNDPQPFRLNGRPTLGCGD